MAIGELAVLIPIVGMSIPIVGLVTRHRRQMMELRIRELEAQASSGSGISPAIEDRLRVLERIVTDRGFNLASEIEALRDARHTEALLDQREKELRP